MTGARAPNFARLFWDQAYATDSDLDHWTCGEPVLGEDDLALLGAVDSRWILDLGCGRGVEAAQLSRDGRKVLALDLSLSALSQIRDPGPTPVAGDAFDLPLPDASVGAVIDCAFLHTLAPESRERYRREVSRVVPSGGLLLVIGALADDEESGLFGVDTAALEEVLAGDFRSIARRPAMLEARGQRLRAMSSSWSRR